MELINLIGIAAVFVYAINDLIQSKSLLINRKLVLLAFFDAIFLIAIISMLLTNYGDLMSYWWLIVILGAPSLYYQFLKIKMSQGLKSIKLIKVGITITLIILVWIKV